MSSAQPTEADNRPKKTRTRASKACLVCRQRKVRCNVALTGSPCSNCRLDHETCVVPERSNRRWSRESNYSSSTAALLEQHRSNLRKPRNRRPDGATNFDMPRSPRPDIQQHTGVFVSANTLEQLGYSSVRAARRIMYGRAKMLYDFETEKSQLHMAQAALLLSYWTPPFEEAAIRPNTGWLRAAIENARSVRAHQWNFNPAKPGPSSEVQMSLRKLWVCCIIRAGTLAISSRRSCQSLGLDSNTTFSLTFDDFKDEIHDSRVYDPRTKKQLVVAFLGLAEMCAQVVAMSALLFPFDNSDAGAKRQIGLVEENSKISDPFNQSRDHPSIALFTNLQHIYYFSARIAFANRLMLSCYDNEGAVPRDVMHLREEVQESTVSIGKCLATLTELNLDRYLPVSVVPCIALPLALNSNTTPTSPKARIFSEAMKTYSRLYEGVDGLARAIRVIVNQERDSQLAESSEISTTTTLVDRTDAFQSGCYMRLALTIDLSLSRGNLPDEADLPVTIRSSSSPESLGQPATVRPLPDSCTGGSPKSDMDSSVSDGNTPRAQPTTNEWLDPNISLPPLSQTDEEDGLWHLAELSPGKTDYDMLESIIWSGLDDSMFS
ncbi:hypothetical protein D7B24_004281 [Verticillium nonalfalfae]|uniref:Zn(2)-C6 fungal-type domain-containing protein n=1 Tax=Verticillium nonalfalfae TaxID=1051616 RepID=A0A3M9YFV2_9PEZI|nr:uncharacterized protein D7B24_004281 [Verticillium nonalfalfae]RNJ58646.1 hypothetical protein D7B24_004281 [Verticillium nonalfalfae]